jgi:hypothetical protein
VRRWLHRFEAEGCAGLAEAPRDYGYARPGWTTALLARLVRRQFKRTVTAECIRQHLAQVDGVCRRTDLDGEASGTSRTRLCSKKGWITRRLNATPRGADLYVEDEAELSLFPTLTRMWMLRGQQCKIRAPGVRPPKRHEYGTVDWRTGDLIKIRADSRNSAGFCRLVEKCMARSAARKRKVVMIVDGANFHRQRSRAWSGNSASATARG